MEELPESVLALVDAASASSREELVAALQEDGRFEDAEAVADYVLSLV